MEHSHEPVRVAEAAEAAVDLLVGALEHTPPTPLLQRPPGLDPVAAARTALARALRSDPRVSGWVVLDAAGSAVALLVATLEVTDEDHPAYTYLPERYAQVTLAGWAVAGADDAPRLAELVGRVAADARRVGVRRLMVQTRPHDWVCSSVWQELGLRPAMVTAARRTSAAAAAPEPASVRVRDARPADHDVLVRLALEEHEHHAAHSSLGVRAVQSVGPTRRIVEQWTDPSARAGALVAEDAGGAVIGCLASYLVDLPPTNPAAFSHPRRYGYLGLTSVTARARGQGAGRALVATALRRFAEQGRTEVLLDYVESNELSKSFWIGRGFAPHVVTLAGDVLG